MSFIRRLFKQIKPERSTKIDISNYTDLRLQNAEYLGYYYIYYPYSDHSTLTNIFRHNSTGEVLRVQEGYQVSTLGGTSLKHLKGELIRKGRKELYEKIFGPCPYTNKYDELEDQIKKIQDT